MTIAIHDLAPALLSGDRRALARAITLAESTRDDHRSAAEALIETVLPATGKAWRLGLSGAPGVGKSTLIEALGLYLVASGHRVAVLAVDPSSVLGGGAILGDKTRMERLARETNAFIRPSPSANLAGGVARRTREAILLAEAAGFDVVIVETVGVGQSEMAVADMVDLFCLLLQPQAGDELQGLKRGIVERAELILITKADGETAAAAEHAVAEYRSALRLLRQPSAAWTPEVWPVSAMTGRGLDTIWSATRRHREALEATGELAQRRLHQNEQALWAEFSQVLLETARHRPSLTAAIGRIEAAVRDGAVTPGAGARDLVRLVLGED